MKRIVLGLFILATLLVLPLSGALVNGWYEAFQMQDFMVPLCKLLIAMVVGGVGTVVLVRQSRLRERLAPQPKGAALMLVGALTFIAFPAILAMNALVFKLEVLSFFPMHALTHYPALLLLAAGAFRVLLHLKPAA